MSDWKERQDINNLSSKPQKNESLSKTGQSAIEGFYDRSKWRYETRSPHDDFQLYNDLMFAEQQHEVGQNAATAGSLSGAIHATLAARSEAQQTGESKIDQAFYEKHGRTPYTQDFFPELTEEDQPKSLTEEDILLSEMERQKSQQEKELQEDLAKFDNRPRPAYYDIKNQAEIPKPEKKEKDVDMTKVQASMRGVGE